MVPQGERPDGVIVHLFEWTWPDVARECENFLGPHGYEAVQVSPPNEHVLVAGRPWWQRYQPVSYLLTSRSGTRAQFASMVARCRAAGVDVYVDAVINHMAAVGSGTGSAGSTYTPYSHPGLWSYGDFHHCGRNGNDDIANYYDRYEVQTCELLGLADLDTGATAVRDRIAAYLNDLIALGVTGFRIDAAKHIAAADLAAIVARLDGDPYVYQEVIEGGGEPIRASEYTGNGDVTELAYSREISRVFLSGSLAWLASFGPSWGFLPGASAQVFTDNHDNQRGHGSGGTIVTFRDGALHDLANVFALAWPYGHPSVMSSYEFANGDQGPPSDAQGATVGPWATGSVACGRPWVCEHRHRPIAGMVGFRTATGGAGAVTDWWSNGNDQIAFGRGARGYVVINAEAAPVTRTFQTSMAAGTYCNVTVVLVTAGTCLDGPAADDIVTVDAAGRFTATVAPMTSLAVHVGARPAVPGTLTGRVTAAGSGSTVPGAWVVAVRSDGVFAGGVATGADGRFSLPVAAGSYRVQVIDPSGARVGQWFDGRGLGDYAGATVLAVGAGASVPVDVGLAPSGGAIGGVVSADGGGGLIGAWVVAVDSIGVIRGGAVTDATGRYAIEGLRPGGYRVAAVDPSTRHRFEFHRDRGDFASAVEVQVTAGATATVDVGLAPAATAPSPSAWVNGRVTVDGTGAPITGAWVAAVRSDGTFAGGVATGADGRFSLPVAAGSYRVQVIDPSGARVGQWFDGRGLGDYAGASVVTVAAGASVVVDAALAPIDGSLAGTVSGDEGGPVGGAWTVALDGATGAIRGGAVADGSGRFTIGGLPAGTYRVAVVDPSASHGFEYHRDRADFAGATSVSVRAGGVTDVALSLAPR